MRRLIPAAALLVLVGLLIWAFLPRPVEVETAEIALPVLEIAVEEEGEARIRKVFTVSATIAGKLQRISLHPGDNVTDGKTIVARIGPVAPVLLDSRARALAEATAAAAQAAVSSALANLGVREKELESALAVLRPDGSGAGPTCCVQVLAPASGRVLRVLTESEQVVQPGTPILEIGDPGNLEIVVELLSRDAVRVQPASAVGEVRPFPPWSNGWNLRR